MRINLIGTGGNGSWLIPMLAKLAETEPIDVTLWDNDIIEEKNIRNQNFQFIKIGEPKAKVLADYYNYNCKLKIPFKYQIKKYDNTSCADIIITAVDNDKTRLEVADLKTWDFWLDCGVNPEMSYAALNTHSSSPSKHIFIVPPDQQEPACTEFHDPVQNIIAASSTFLLLDSIINNQKLELPFITHTRNNGISTITDTTKGYPMTWTCSFRPCLEVILDKQLTLSWFLHWFAVQNFRTDNPGKLCFKRNGLNLKSKTSDPDIKDIIKTYWSDNISHPSPNNSKLFVKIIQIFNNFDQKSLSICRLSSTDPNEYYPIAINSGSKRTEIYSVNWIRCPHNVLTSKSSNLSNNPIIFNDLIENQMSYEKLNIFDTIRINLSVFILALQFQEGFINKHQIEWFDKSKCITRKIKLTEDALREYA